MSRLPTVQTFGARPTPRPQRGVHAVRVIDQGPSPLETVADIAVGFAEKFAEEDARDEAKALDTEFSNSVRALQMGDGSDERPGYLNLRGQAAIDGRESHIVGLEKLHETMMGKASNDRVRELVGRPFNFRLKSALDASVTHFGKQRRVASAATFQAHQAATADDAIVAGHGGNAEGVLELATLAGAQAAAYAKQTGADPTFEAEAAITSILTSEIERRAASDADSAREFFDEHRDDIDGRRHVAIAAMLERAEAKADGLVRGTVNDAIAVLDRGRLPANLAGVQAAARGTIHETPLSEAIEDRAHVHEFMREPLAEQSAELQARPETITRRALATEDRKRRAHDALRRDIATGHGLPAAAELDVIEAVDPVNLSEPESLRRRTIQADIASQHFGVRISPLLPAEADAIAKEIDQAPADQTTAMLAGLREGLGREGALSLVGQLADKRPELALALVNVAERPLLAREIVLGGRLLKENKDVAPGKPDRQGAIAEVFGTEDRSVFNPDTATALAPILDAASALYAGRRVPTGDLSYDADTFETALREVVGGVFSFNDRNILSPVPGMGEDGFEDSMERLTQPDLIEFGNGVPLFGNGDPFTTSHFESRFFGPEAQLVTAGFGRYLVTFPGLGFVMNELGEPYELDLAAFIRGRHE